MQGWATLRNIEGGKCESKLSGVKLLWSHLQGVTVLYTKTKVHALVTGLHIEHGHGTAIRCESALIRKQSNADVQELFKVFC